MNCARNTEIIRKHFHDHQENLCFQSFLCAKNFALTKVSFIQRAFKYSKTYVENSRTFQGCPTIFNFQGVFKDMMLFQGLFKARANHANILIHAPI